MEKALFPLLCVVLACTSLVSGDGRVLVRFLSYDNPDGTGANGHCCDGRWSACSTECDHMFHVCLDDNISDDMDTCRYGDMQSSAIDNQNHIDFSDEFGGVRNPMEFAFSGALQGAVAVKVDVWDYDALTGNDFVEFIYGQLSSQTLFPASSQHLILHAATPRTSLLAEVSVVCDADWYTDNEACCGVHCPAPADSDHYHCDASTGRKVCEGGWTGEDCAERLTTTTTTTTTPRPTGTAGSIPYVNHDNADCDNAVHKFHYVDAVFRLQVASFDSFDAYCDVNDRDEGWTVLMRRANGLVDFDRGWDEYKEGFGQAGARTEHWLGLEKMYWLTNQRSYKARITMQLGNLEYRYAEYENFRVGSAKEGYALHVSGYSGDAGDSLSGHNGVPFSTPDHDNDYHCARLFHSGWWFYACYDANLNGPYLSHDDGWPRCPSDLSGCVQWTTIEEYGDYSLKQAEIKILPHL